MTALTVAEQRHLNSEDSDWAGITLASGEAITFNFAGTVTFYGYCVIASAALDLLKVWDTAATVPAWVTIADLETYIDGVDPLISWYAPYALVEPYEAVDSIQFCNNTGSPITVTNIHVYMEHETTQKIDFISGVFGIPLEGFELNWGDVSAGTSQDLQFRVQAQEAGTVTVVAATLTSATSSVGRVDYQHYMSLDGATWTASVSFDLAALQISNVIHLRRVTPLSWVELDPHAFRLEATLATVAAEFHQSVYGYIAAPIWGSEPHVWSVVATSGVIGDTITLYGHGWGTDELSAGSYVIAREGITNVYYPTSVWSFVTATADAYGPLRTIALGDIDPEHGVVATVIPENVTYPTLLYSIVSDY